MSDYIKKIRTTTGDKQIDYTALANLPNLLTVDTTLSQSGKAADAKAVGEEVSKVKNQLDNSKQVFANAIIQTKQGEAVMFDDGSELPFKNIKVFGKSTQDGTPTPDAPVEIVSVENPMVFVAGKNLLPVSYKNGVSRTHGGLTYTVQEDGGVHVTGTVTSAESYFVLSDFDFGEASVGKGQSNGVYTWSDCLYNAPSHYTMLYFSQGREVDQVCYPQVELGTVATEWEKPIGQTISITHTLPGIPVASGGNYTDENGQQWICDEVDFERGVYVQRVKVGQVNIRSLGTLNNGLVSGIYRIDDKAYSLNVGAVCDRAEFVGMSGNVTTQNQFYENANSFGFSGTPEDTLETLKARYDGAIIYYVLATPIETPLSETEIVAYRALHANSPITTVTNDAGAWTEVSYNADANVVIKKLTDAIVALGGTV